MKTSTGKATWPGRKQIWRVMGARAVRDVVALHEEPPIEGARALLERVMVDGARTSQPPPLADLRASCLENIAELPADLRRIDVDAGYTVAPSRGLTDAIAAVQDGDAHEV